MRQSAIQISLASIFCMPIALAQAQSTVSAEEEELARTYGDKAFVSIATGARQPLSRAPAVTTVITAEEIAKMGATDLNAALEMVPGMHVERAAFYYLPIYVMRGIYNVVNIQVLVLLNGVPITFASHGVRGADLGDIPLEHVARIEVVRGPASALYGADAYSGVINVITKSPADVHGTQVGVRYGTFASRDAWIEHGGKLGEIELSAYLRLGSTAGSKEIIDADNQSARDKIFKSHASLAPGPISTTMDAADVSLDATYQQWRARLNYQLRDNIGTGVGVASSLDPIGKLKGQRIIYELGWAQPEFAEGWGGSVQMSYVDFKLRVPENLRLSPPGLVLPTGVFPDGQIGHPETSEHQLRLSTTLTYSGFAQHKFRIGLGHDDINLYQTATIKNYVFSANGVPAPAGAVQDFSTIQPFLLPQRRKLNYVYLQDEWQLAKDWTITGGIRYDRYSDFGSTTNPRLALVWKASYELTAKLLYGSAFRAPSFNEAYGINNPVLRGNPNLKPETIRTTEAALSWQMRPDTQWNINVYRYRMKDVIGAAPLAGGASGAMYGNVGSQQGKGLELEVSTDAFANWHLVANYAYQNAINLSNQQDVGYAPHHHFYARADWKMSDKWQWSAQLNHVAERARSAGDNRPPIANYTAVDLSLRSTTLFHHWNVSASIRNLFNADIREPSVAPGVIPNDLPMPHRNGYLQASYLF